MLWNMDTLLRNQGMLWSRTQLSAFLECKHSRSSKENIQQKIIIITIAIINYNYDYYY